MEAEAGVDKIIDEAFTEKLFTGIACGIWRRGAAVYRRVEGYRSLEPEDGAPEPLGEDSLFDLASMTKALATSILAHKAIESGALRLEDPLGRILPEAESGTRELTIASLLSHTSGLPAIPELQRWFPDASKLDRKEAIRRLLSIALERKAGEEVVYSCTGFLFLGLALERISGLTMGELFRREIAQPLGLPGARFAPGRELRSRTVATELCAWRGARIRGAVHDESSYCLLGEAGNAGLFSGLDDAAKIAAIFLEEGSSGGKRILEPESIRLMTNSATEGMNRRRSLGLMMHDAESPDGPTWSDRSFGHSGFTGTSMYIEPGAGLLVIILSNSVYHGRQGSLARMPTFRRSAHAAALSQYGSS